MNYKNACSILDIQENDDCDCDITIIKRQYRLKALLYHPDKNQSPDASKRFHEIHGAYEYLMKFQEMQDEELDEDFDEEFEYADKTAYKSVLFSFLKNILQPDSRNKLLHIILQRVVSKCDATAIDMLTKLDKTTLIKIYDILRMYEDAFHFTKDVINKIETIIADKIKNDECIILNPTLNDLFENNLYKLTVNDFTYIVPLWHDELVYDNSGNDIFVKCFPMLPEHVCIDNKNDIHINVTYRMQELWCKEIVYLQLCQTKKLILNPQLLKLTPVQTVIYAKQGISRINTESIYDVSKQSDIHLHIHIDI
jgi:hypothetical protein